MHTYRGESHNGHLAERCSVKIAMKRSREPKHSVAILKAMLSLVSQLVCIHTYN